MATLSKSKLIAFRQCPKRMWLEIHRPELREDSFGTEVSYRIGNEVGEVAKRIYAKNGAGTEIDAQRDGYPVAISQSQALLATPNQVLFEPAFKAEGLIAFADVMLPDHTGGDPGWKMVEVKSSTKVKDYHHDDVAVQSYVAQQSGVNLKSVAVACVDSSWTYPGNGDYRGLLIETDLTAEAFGRTTEVEAWSAAAHEVADHETEPSIETGGHCYDPFECGFCTYCNLGKPQPTAPLIWLPRFSGKRRSECHEQGITELHDLPDDGLNSLQLRVKGCSLSGSVYFDAKGAAEKLQGLSFPAYFLDFETWAPAVPIWAGTRPYQAVTVQFSIHQLSEARELHHHSFLDLSGDDPSERFAETLIVQCGQNGPIFVYNQAFEATCVRKLADRFPARSNALLAIVDRMVDLLPVARQHYYHPSQHGSWSIKAVLPAIAPDLNYDQLEGVADGAAAMEAYGEAIRPDTTLERKDEIRHQLETYCRLDTFALVRLWQFFRGDKEWFTDSR
jgi:hypothetical protein